MADNVSVHNSKIYIGQSVVSFQSGDSNPDDNVVEHDNVDDYLISKDRIRRVIRPPAKFNDNEKLETLFRIL